MTSFRKAPSTIGTTASARRSILILAFLIPFLPRPTLIHPARLVGPAVIAGALFVFALLVVTHRLRRTVDARLRTLIFLSAAACALYLTRLALTGYLDEELELLYSRFLLFGIVIAVVRYLELPGATLEELFRVFLLGYLANVVIQILIGVSGVTYLEPVRPARTLGFSIPFFKTTGTPRSFGEFGILTAAALSYVLVYRNRLGRVNASLALMAIGFAVLISQSRNVILTAFVVIGAYAVMRRTRNNVLGYWILAAALLIPFVIDEVLPAVEDVAVVESLVGRGVLASNVEARFELVDLGVEFLTDRPEDALFGHDWASWYDFTIIRTGMRISPHNHFIATFVTFGLLGGALVMYSLFVHPVIRMLRVGFRSDHERQLVYLAFVGAIVSLSFYEGFFSPILGMMLGVVWFVGYGLSPDGHSVRLPP